MWPRSIFIGFDPREAAAFAVARGSIKSRLSVSIPIFGIVKDRLETSGLYTRPTSHAKGQLWDVISEAPMSTEFAISRFFTPHLAMATCRDKQRRGWALFVDCDVMARDNLCRLFDLADDKYAVMCVKHDFVPSEKVKMDGQIQTRYARKNWSSVMLFNLDHPSNEKLSLEVLNTLPGRDLHRFCWLTDSEIGELPAEWNYLVGHTSADSARLVHFTDGIPSMPGYEQCEFADEWRDELSEWASGC